MEILQADHSAHYYKRDGSPLHRVPYADKKREGETRPTTLTDARKMDLLPSVSSILSIINKPGLELWKAEMAILSALTLPREQGEVDDAFARRVAQDMKASTRLAADRGTKIHRAIENWLTNKFVYLDRELEPVWEPVLEWLQEEVQEVIMAEQSLVHQEEQYAGTVDLIAILKSYGPMLCDFKTQGYKDKPNFYDEWQLQLEAYRRAYQHSYPRATQVGIASLVVSSEVPRPVEVFIWPSEGTESRWRAFCNAHGLWRWSKDYALTTQQHDAEKA